MSKWKTVVEDDGDTIKRKASESGTAENANDRQYEMYKLVDQHGGGELMPWVRYGMNGGDFSFLDGLLEARCQGMMFNGGKGKLESIASLVKRRNKERNERLGAFSRKKGKGKSQPNILDDLDQEGNQGDLKKVLKLLDGGKGGKGDSKYREIVWNYDFRGSMGENVVCCCLLQGTTVHNALTIRLIDRFPPLVNDIFVSEDYYGLSPLHLAIVNDDPWMVGYLLRRGADINQRCYGAHFCPEDQINSRTDSLEHEFVDMNLSKTNYTGKMYFGEYPLAFAASIGQIDCYRLLRARRADPNAQDTNGNTVLHMTVIHEKPEMFRIAYDSGAKLHICNKQQLTPLTLAAKLAKKEMFDEILRLECITLWKYGEATSVQYPLAKIDTINEETGELNPNSALSLVIYGETTEHLDLLDGVLEEILDAKWNTFGRRRWFISLASFTIYYTFLFFSFTSRPFAMTTSILTGDVINYAGDLTNATVAPYFYLPDGTSLGDVENSPKLQSEYFYDADTCHLWHYDQFGFQGYVRLVCEPIVFILAIAQVGLECHDVYNIGRKRYWQVQKSFPDKIIFKVSLLLIFLIPPVRLLCGFGEVFLFFDNFFSIVVVITTTVNFLYYCRAIEFVGPFVLMVFTIILRDISRFIMIYTIFLMGFSQAFYLIFMACNRAGDPATVFTGIGVEGNAENILENPLEAIMRLFIATAGEFMVFYQALNSCPIVEFMIIGKIFFVTYQLFVSLMQLNLLIAMMTRTYDWAQVILMLELSIRPADRLHALLKYSLPIGTNRNKRAFVVTGKADYLTAEANRKLRENEEHDKLIERRNIMLRRLKGMHKDDDLDKSERKCETLTVNVPEKASQ